MANTTMNFTGNGSDTYEAPNGANINIEGTFDGATITLTMTGATTAARTPATAAENFNTPVQKGTLTVTSAGASTDIDVIVEPSRGMWG